MVRVLWAALVLVLVIAAPSATVADDTESLAGKLLVAGEGMGDPRFAESLVYIVRHNDEGAFGLVVNRPLLRVPSSEIYDRLGVSEPDTTAPLDFHFGGPVQSEIGFVLHSGDFSADGTMSVDGGLSVSGLRAVLVAIARGEGPKRVMFALGYSGWGPGQLEGEIARDDWVAIEGDETLVFDIPFAERWPQAIRRRGLDL